MRAYIKSFSYSELLSALFSAIMLISLLFLFNQLNLPNKYYILFIVTICISLILSHRFYLLEHKQRNRFFGRVIHDFIISVFVIIILTLALKISGTFYVFGFYKNLITVVLFVVFSFEIFLSIVNRILIRIGWHIW